MKTCLFILVAILLSCACMAIAHAGGSPVSGGGKSSPPSIPAPAPPPAPLPIPDTTPQEAVSRAVRDEERRRLSRQKGVGGTVLAPLGQLGGGGQGNSNTLLGRIG